MNTILALESYESRKRNRKRKNPVHGMMARVRNVPILAACLSLAALCNAQTQQAYTISTVAGNNSSGFSGDGGSATAAQIAGPFSVWVDSSGNLFIADQLNQRIRKVSSGTISTVAGSGINAFTGDGGPATKASLSFPQGVATDSTGNIYISDTNNYCVRKVSTSGTISTIAGMQSSGGGYAGDGGPGTAAVLTHPVQLAFDAAGNLYIADANDNAIRMLTPGGTISTVAGYSGATFSGDGGPATSAGLNNPDGVAVDRAGNIYISDGSNHRIRMVNTSGIISTIAGTGIPGFSGDGGPAKSARINSPRGIAVDTAGNLYIADYSNQRIRVISANGIISTVAGTGANGYAGDGGPATSARLSFPSGVAVDTAGNLYVADNQNNVIRKLTPAAGLPAITSGGVVGAGSFGAFTSIAPGSWIEIYGSGLAADSRGWATSDFSGSNAPTSLDGTSVTIGGMPAFVDYISANQVNAQVPSTVATGTQSVSVTNSIGASALYSIHVNAIQPGLDAPPSFNIGGKQYAVALFTGGSTYVLPPASLSGVTSRQAKPGETITFYGVGFGPVTPNILAGQVVGQSNALASNLQLSFAQVPAALTYSGLAPGAVGLYQFNAVVPNIANSDLVPLTFTLNGTAGTQTLYTAVHN